MTKRKEARAPHARGEGKHELKTVYVDGPRSVRTRIRLALLRNLFLNEKDILAAIQKQRGGKELLRDYGDQLGSIKVQAAQVRKELQERAGIKGSRRSPRGRELIGKKWQALPIAQRREIINSFGERASYWLSEYDAEAA